MGKVAFLFAGQGAQRPGMGADVFKASPAARAVFEAVDAARPGTSELCFSGTAEELGQTINTQPAVFATDLAFARALEEAGIVPDVVAGFSLGEVAALAFAEAYADFEAAELVSVRASLMADAAARNPGEMRAVLKLDAATVEELAAQAGDAWPVNYNSPQQTVVAGTPEALQALDSLVREARGRSMRVAVSGGFHSPLMQTASEGLWQWVVDGHEPQEPTIPVIANATAEPYPADVAGRAALLSRQVASPVLWVDTLERLAAEGVTTFVEVGPGSTLTGLVKRTLKDVTALPCGTVEELSAVVQALAKEGE